MDIPRYASADRRQSLALPEIHIHNPNANDRYGRFGGRSASFQSMPSPINAPGPMSIPNAQEPVPPPLPPPRFIPSIQSSAREGPDIAWQWENARQEASWPKSNTAQINPGSSLCGGPFGGHRREPSDERPSERRSSSTSTVKSISDARYDRRDNYPRIDEGYHSLSGTSIGSSRSKFGDSALGKTEFSSSVHDQFRSNAADYDKSLLQKLDSRPKVDNKSPPHSFPRASFSSSAGDTSPTSRQIALEQRERNLLKPLSLPINPGKPGLSESPLARWADNGTPAISPRNPGPFGQSGPFDFRSPTETVDPDKSPRPYIRRSGSGSVLGMGDDTSSISSHSNRGSYDHNMFMDAEGGDFNMEETGFRRLRIDDRAYRTDAYSPGATTGQKRRASSPPRDDSLPSLHMVSSASDLFRRRDSASRASPTPRLRSNCGSISSTASGPRTNSYASSLSIAASSITTNSSYGRLSPGGISPGGISPGATDTSLDSPYLTTGSIDPSPVSRPNHQRTLSETRPLMSSRKLTDNISHAKSSSAGKLQGIFICECCPKKPKKFDTSDELTAHEQEKQYECAYCRNRFKNKNEAERHQNSLHLRKHSWSCAALADFGAAFHTSTVRPGEADTCGYCGEDFPKSGISSNGSASHPSGSMNVNRFATDQDWQLRITHLQEVHKFRECNHAKKFFRADHFRQHLKHSHAGTSGKWTNMLENACMKDEPLPIPLRDRAAGSISSQSAMLHEMISEEGES